MAVWYSGIGFREKLGEERPLSEELHSDLLKAPMLFYFNHERRQHAILRNSRVGGGGLLLQQRNYSHFANENKTRTKIMNSMQGWRLRLSSMFTFYNHTLNILK